MDLDLAGFEFTGLDHGVTFDIDADGLPERLAWTDGKSQDLLLCWDRNRNGVSEAQELSTLREAGVTALAVEYRVSLQRDDHGNHLRLLSTAHLRDKSGETMTTDTVDVFFVVASPVLSPP